MTVQQQHDFFNLIQDKFNAPYFIGSEVDIFLNRAQEEFVNNLIFKDILGKSSIPKGPQSIYSIEDTILSNEVLNTLIIPNKAVTSDSGGTKVTYADISSSLMHILSVITSATNTGYFAQYKAIKFIRYNDLGRFQDNIFKKGTIDKPYYKIGNDGIYFYPPSGTTEQILVSYMKKPVDVELGVTESELPIYTHIKVVILALVLAGVATESEILTAMDKL
jgi:hypothetical protein